LRWLTTAQLDPAQFPPANRLIIRRLQLRDRIAIINVPDSSADALQLPGDALVRLRCQHKGQYSDYLTAAQSTLSALSGVTAGVMIDLSTTQIAGDGLIHQALCDLAGLKGLHAHSGLLHTLTTRPVPEHLLFGVSCHTGEDLAQAQTLDADYALLSPVLATASHPDDLPLGWDRFATLAAASSVPVYALGGMTAPDLAIARARGGRGIAGISLFSSGRTR
jgi:8-oxo-dGTP diphosphatase